MESVSGYVMGISEEMNDQQRPGKNMSTKQVKTSMIFGVNMYALVSLSAQ